MRGFGQHGQRKAQEAVGAHLEQHPGEHDTAGRRRLHMGVGQPCMQRHHGHLHREGDQKGQEHPCLYREWIGLLRKDKNVESLPALEIQHQDADQEQHAARQRVEEELERRIDPVITAPDANDDVHWDQHRFPENVEKKQVQRTKDAEHQTLHDKEANHELLDLGVDGLPRRDDADPTQKRGQEHEQHADPVDAQGIRDSKRRHPSDGLAELHGIGGRIEGQ